MMQRRQKGSSALLVLIAVVVLVAFGLSAYYAWGAQHKPASQSNGSLEIKEWGIRIPVAGYSYKIIDANNYSVTSPAIIQAAKAINCTDDTFGGIIRSTTPLEGPVTTSPKIGQYYYGFHARTQAACIDDKGQSPNPNTINGLMDTGIQVFMSAMPHATAD